MITADASIVANHLNEYVYNLHRYLGPFCFTKGAFVIEDDGTLLTLLNQYSPTYISGKLRSHKSFLTDPESYIYECAVDLILECKNCIPNVTDSVHVRNIKWYPFAQGTKSFIFFKLEGHPTFYKMGMINFSHTWNYFKRHYSKNNAKCVERREDCKSDECLKNASELNHKYYQIGTNQPVPIMETYARVRDEMFIPLAVSKIILENIDKKLKFDFLNGIVTINLDNTPLVVTNSVPNVEQEDEEEIQETIGGKSMPYFIRKLPNRRLYSVKSKDRTFAKGTTLKKAKAQVRLLYARERQQATRKRR